MAAANARELARRLAAQGPGIEAHSGRLALLGSVLGVGLGLAELEIRMLRHGAYLHDVGKTAIARQILHKHGPLTEAEWEEMRQHPILGEQMCRDVPGLEGTLSIIRGHHERWDGSGYPDKLRGEEISILARITQIVDIFDALTSQRPYRQPDTPQQALRTIQEETALGWRDPQLVTHFERLFPLFAAPIECAVGAHSLIALNEAVRRGRWV
jgi:putative two-component system response regulator